MLADAHNEHVHLHLNGDRGDARPLSSTLSCGRVISMASTRHAR
jgi:hypothetical protein